MLDWISKIFDWKSFRAEGVICSLNPVMDDDHVSPLGCFCLYVTELRLWAYVPSVTHRRLMNLLDLWFTFITCDLWSQLTSTQHVMLQQCPAPVAIATSYAEANLWVVEKQPKSKSGFHHWQERRTSLPEGRTSSGFITGNMLTLTRPTWMMIIEAWDYMTTDRITHNTW